MERPREIRVSVAALALPGLVRPARPSPRALPEVVRRLSRGEGPEELRRVGLVAEALCLEDDRLLDAAESADFVAFSDPVYPDGWRRLDRPPGALWRSGAVLPAGPWTGGVGSREVDEAVREWCREVGAACGTAIVSGGAVGCDLAFASGASRTVHLLPHGRFDEAPDGVTLLSPFAPGEPFTAANAMFRNRLIHAAAETSVVGHFRPRIGGTWHGAIDAIRTRLAPLIVRDAPEAAALIALGAIALADSADFPAAREEALRRRDGLFPSGTL